MPDPSTQPSPSDREFSNLGDALAGSLLHLALSESTPVEELVTQLADGKGESWFNARVEARLGLPLESPEAGLIEGTSSVDELSALKALCEESFDKAKDSQERAAATLSYCLVIAAALIHHGTIITSRNRLELEAVFKELAPVTPLPWREVFARAAQVVATL